VLARQAGVPIICHIVGDRSGNFEAIGKAGIVPGTLFSRKTLMRMKWHGKLVGIDLNKVRRTIERSRDAVLASAGYSSDRFDTCCSA
jgi:hypothetical protein